MESKNEIKSESGINYYVIAVIFISALFFVVANAFEPQINTQLDFFELVFILGMFAPAVFSFIIARRYWPSPVFGKAYLSLGLAYALTAIGAIIFDYYQIVEKIENPYPSIADVFFMAFYPFAIYHLRTNIHFIRRVQKPELKKSQIMLLIVIPLGVAAFYTFGLLYQPVFHDVGIPDESTSLNLVPRIFTQMTFDSINNMDLHTAGFYLGIVFVAATSLTFAWAIIGAQVFRGSSLGAPWGMLLVGIAMNTIADVSYYYTSISSYDRSNPIIGMWILGDMLVCYALYLHKKQL
ncbi:MAG: hypothetical protein ACHQW9_01125 [Nitrososphaerales archaeon]|jgi:hypothetical protein